ncbi:MAG: hydroxymethylbilane synthase [Blastocatellia bacterium]|nr:hydroxymethylbilane synthase [Blastocatellia bacterium]
MRDELVIGTRGSELALWQANFVKRALEAAPPGRRISIKTISTTGDIVMETALSKIGDKGLFTRQIETELLNGEIDLAVHSLKDLQTEQPAGLIIGAVCPRGNPRDAFVSDRFENIDSLPQGATVASGSLRRRSQLMAHRPDLNIVEIRGNVPTRLRKFDESDVDAMILACAGLERLGLDARIRQMIPTELMIPAVGQGTVAVEIRDGDTEAAELCRAIDDPATRVCVTAERAFLRTLEGGCQVPIGGYAVLKGHDITLTGYVGSLDGAMHFRESHSGPGSDAEAIGLALAEKLIALGASDLLDEARGVSSSSQQEVL